MAKEFNTKSFLSFYFWAILAFFVILAGLRIFYSTGYLLDTYEHIHASWLVSTGLVPYRDFFEHHHPLLWYLFAPVTQLFYRDVSIIFVARFIAVLGYLWTLYLTYVLARYYSKSKTGGLFAILFVLCIPSLWLDVQNLRPDIFMYISILAAIKYFFDYLDKHQVKYLCFSYFLWFIAFLFLQKTIIFGFGFTTANVWLLYKKRILITDFFKALLLPVILFMSLLLFLNLTNTLDQWYKCNFTFNFVIKNHFGNHSSGISPFLPYLTLFIALIIFRIFRFHEKGNVLFCIWLFSNLSLLDFAPHPQYYFFTFVLSAVMLAPFLNRIYKKKPMITLVLATIFLVHTFYVLFVSIFSGVNLSRMKDEVALVNYVLQNTTPQEKLLNGHYAYNLFNPDTHYYWLEFYTIIILADLYLDKHIDYNEQIKTHRPKFLFIPKLPYDRIALSNSYWIKERNFTLIQKASRGDTKALSKLSTINLDYWQIDMDYIKENYRRIDTYGAAELWQRIDNTSGLD